MEFDLTQLVSFGVGGVIAAIVLYWKRVDDQKWTDLLKTMWDESRDMNRLMIAAFEANAIAMAALRDVCENSANIDDLERRLGDAIDALNRLSPSPTDTAQRATLHTDN